MAEGIDARFLALLVHRGLLSPQDAKAALGSGDPRDHLVGQGIVAAEKLEEWLRTEAGTRPELTRYGLGELLGEGGTARVFAARDRKNGQRIALKVLLPEVAADPDALSRFIRESRLLIELEHESIVKGYRVAREGTTFFCAMELIEGECLQDRLERGEVLDEELALKVVVQMARAFTHLHGRGLVHRDVKPGNILLTADQRAVLIDLGFAVQETKGESADLSETTAGTIYYISPEQAKGQADLDVRADIYSLGATLYHLVTGSLPFEGRTSEEVLAKQVLASLSSERIRALQLSPQIHYFIEKMMAKEKEIRFQKPGDLVTEVGAYLDSLEHERSAPTRDPSSRRRRRRRPLR